MKLYILMFLSIVNFQLFAQEMLSVTLSKKSNLIEENRSYQWCIDRRVYNTGEAKIERKNQLKDGAVIRIAGKLNMVYNDENFPHDTLVLMPGVTDSNKLFVRTINIRPGKQDTSDIYLARKTYASKGLGEKVFQIEIDSVRMLHQNDTVYRKCIFFCYLTNKKGQFVEVSSQIEDMKTSFSFCLVSNVYLEGFFEHKKTKYVVNIIINPRVGEVFNDKVSKYWHANDIVKIYRVNEKSEKRIIMDRSIGDLVETLENGSLSYENNNFKYVLKGIDFENLTLKIKPGQKIVMPFSQETRANL